METAFVLRSSDGREFGVSRETRLGQSPPCEILLGDPRVAPLHATLWIQNNYLFVRDEGSSVGTFVNDTRLPAGTPFQLRPGDRLLLGDTALTVVDGDRPVSGPPGVDDALLDSSPPPSAPLGFALRLPDGRDFAITRDTRIGRDLSCNIRLEDTSVSGHHATASLLDGLLLVRDEGSTNGTYVNDTRLIPRQPSPLRPGDRLRLGQSVVVVVARSDLSVQPPAARPPATQAMPRSTVKITFEPPPLAQPAALVLRGSDGRVCAVSGETLVGRDPACQIRLSDPQASRRHAVLWRQYGTLMVRDEKSSNGTFVNDARLEPGQTAALRPGDRVRFADTLFTVTHPGMAAGLAAPSGSWPQAAPRASAQPPVLASSPAYAPAEPPVSPPSLIPSPVVAAPAPAASRGRWLLVLILLGGIVALIACLAIVAAALIFANRSSAPAVATLAVLVSAAAPIAEFVFPTRPPA